MVEHDLAGLYEELWPSMVRLAKLLVGSDAAAEDVVQDAFLAVSPKLGGLDNPRGYLRTAVVNMAKGRHRRAAVAERHQPEPPRVSGDPEIDETWAVLARLPYRQRAVLVLRFYEDMSEADIANVLACRPGTVKSATHRALARMREELS
ncbi:MAG TPA: SigE family RNA polymerase sigma factor [Acidimicrobiales bacterium]|nr:SigE family RNA polymerase sigma factor [Acidimicrobiales bacterium]